MTVQGAFGVKLKITIGTVLTAITNLLSVPNFPEQRKMLADMTAHPTSGSTGYMTKIDTGVRELTPFEVTLGWDDVEATHAAILTAFAATAAVNMSIEDPGGAEVIAFASILGDEHHQPMFSLDEISELAKKNFQVIRRLSDIAFRLTRGTRTE